MHFHSGPPMHLLSGVDIEFLSEDGACTNQAESFFARRRRSKFGIHHLICGRHHLAYSRECA
jgi:hypothetical protein